MSFFREYIARKSFNTWRSLARTLAFRSVRLKLSRRLFLAKPAFAAPFVRMHSLFQVMGTSKLLAIEALGRGTVLQSFFGQQQELGSTGDLEARAREAQDALDPAIQAVTCTAARLDVSGVPFEMHMVAPTSQVSPHKGCSLREEKAAAQLQAQKKRLSKFDLSLLQGLIRLADVMQQSYLVRLVVQQAQEFYEKIQRSTKVFSVTVAFTEDDGVEITPERSKLEDALHDVLNFVSDRVSLIPSVMSSKKYEKHIRECVSLTPTGDVARRSADFRSTEEAILERMAADYERAKRLAESYFEHYLHIFRHVRNWDPAALDSCDLTNRGLVAQMSQMCRLENELETLKLVHPCGMFLIDGKTLQSSLLPMIDTSLTAMKACLRRTARDQCEAAIARFDQAIRELHHRSARLEHFVEYMQNLRIVEEKHDALESARSAVEDLYMVGRQYHIRLDFSEEAAWEKLGQKCRDLECVVLPEAQAFARDHLAQNIEEAGRRISVAEGEAEALETDLRTGEAKDANLVQSGGAKVLETLRAMSGRLDDLRRNTNWLNGCLMSLGEHSQELRVIPRVEKALQGRVHVWEVVHRWQCFTAEWEERLLPTLTLESFCSSLNDFGAAIQDIEEKDAVTSKITELHMAWQKRVAPLIYITSPVLQGTSKLDLLLEDCGVSCPCAEATISSLLKAGFFDEPRMHEFMTGAAAATLQNGLGDAVELATALYKSGIASIHANDWINNEIETMQAVLESPHASHKTKELASELRKKLLN